MRIGPAKEPFEQQLSLHEWCNDTGCGIIGYELPDQLPDEMVDFVFSQFERFKIPIIEKTLMEKIIRAGAWSAFYTIDSYDPYLLLARGISDIAWSDIGHTHSIDIIDPYKKNKYEASPEKLEVFVKAPEQAEEFFNHAMAHPGLDALPFEIGTMLSDVLFNMCGPPEEFCDEAAIGELQYLCHLKEECRLDHVTYKAYWELVLWASFIWMAGPPGKQWRTENHDAFWLCETEGMVVLYDLAFLRKEHYSINERTPQSCFICGLDSYCVELAYVDGLTRHVCEKHLNPEILYPQATCGSKVCKFVQCSHHPYHGQESGLYQMLSGSGQITQLNRQRNPMIATHVAHKMIGN